MLCATMDGCVQSASQPGSVSQSRRNACASVARDERWATWTSPLPPVQIFAALAHSQLDRAASGAHLNSLPPHFDGDSDIYPFCPSLVDLAS